jgi:hypothetical protein
MKNRLLQILTSLSSLFPDKFLSNKIEYVDVKSFCAVRNKTKHDTSNEYRKAFGLSIYNEWTASKDRVIFSKDNKVYDNPAWDFLYDDNNKMGLTYPKVYKDMERNDKIGYDLSGVQAESSQLQWFT